MRIGDELVTLHAARQHIHTYTSKLLHNLLVGSQISDVFGFLQTVSQTLIPHHTRSDTFLNSQFCGNGLTTLGGLQEQILQDRSKILTFLTPSTTH
jgi:hypothetical protein